MPALLPWIVANAAPLIMSAATVGTAMYSAKKQEKGMETARMQNEALYNKYSLPSAPVVQAQATENRGALGQQRLGAYQNLVSNLAARGFGSGSGIGIQGASEIESGYLKSMGEAATNLTKFANTRQFGPTQGMFATPVSGAAETGMAKAGNLLDMAMGYNMMSKILRP